MSEQSVEGGDDFKLVKEDKSLECPICLLLLRETIGTQCGHLLCKVCLENLQISSDSAGKDIICPTCKEKIDCNQVYRNVYIDNVVTGSDVYCLQQDSGCKWIGTLVEYLRKHHDKCDYVIVSCDNIGCSVDLARNLMKEHAVDCPHRLVDCIYCVMEVKFNELNEHYSTCQKIPAPCLMGCGVQVPREKVEEHLDELCGLVKVECQFSNAGCTSKVLRMDLQKHLVDFTHIHMSLLCDKLNQSQKKMEQLKFVNTQSKKKVEQLEVANDQSREKIKQLEAANDQSREKIKKLEEANDQSREKIKQLEVANGQSQKKIKQLECTNDPSYEIAQLKRTVSLLEHILGFETPGVPGCRVGSRIPRMRLKRTGK